LKDWTIVAGPASLDAAAGISSKLGKQLCRIDTTEFPDGESKIRIQDEFRNKNVIVVQSLYPPTDKHLLQLLLIAHRLSEDGADVNAVVPYLAYARQDKQFLQGEVVTLGVVSHLLRSVGIRRVVTVDIHSSEGLGLFSIPIYSVSAIPLLADYVSKKVDLRKPIAIAPDMGASSRVEAFAARLGSEYVSFAKTRDRLTGEVKTEEKNLRLQGRDAVIIDDIISTGGSVAKCAELLKKYGAGRIVVACTHALLIGGAEEKIKKAGVDEIIASNTIPNRYAKVDVSALIASYFEAM
jgi:ribose-phosphate pyrophosphokinase